MMLENLVMLAFVAVLMFCVAFGVPTVAALIAGYVIFILYGMKKGYSVPSPSASRLSQLSSPDGALPTAV